jgi:hypothetical protein
MLTACQAGPYNTLNAIFAFYRQMKTIAAVGGQLMPIASLCRQMQACVLQTVLFEYFGR